MQDWSEFSALSGGEYFKLDSNFKLCGSTMSGYKLGEHINTYFHGFTNCVSEKLEPGQIFHFRIQESKKNDLWAVRKSTNGHYYCMLREQPNNKIVLTQPEIDCVMNNMSQLVWRYDIEEKTYYYNQQLMDIIGDYNLEQCLTDDSRKSYRDAVEVCSRDLKPRSFEVELTDKSKKNRWLSCDVIALVDSTCYAVVGLMTDRTRIKEAEVRERRLKQEAERANISKSQYLSRMSHELRTPLNAISGFAQLLKLTGELPPKAYDQSSKILNASTYLCSLINEVLEITRIEAGRIALSFVRFEVSELVREVIDMMKPLSDRLTVKVDYQPLDPKLTVLLDRRRLQQILLNLVSNAIKYNRRNGSVHIIDEMEDGKYQVHVEDTGVGIPDDKKDQLFTPFNRLGRESSDIDGTGLGMALTRELVQYMGGTIEFQSSDMGTRFTVSLPTRIGTPNLTSPRLRRINKEMKSSHDNRKSVLHIDNDFMSLELVSNIMGRWGRVALTSVSKAKLGFDVASAHRPDLIIIGSKIPDATLQEVVSRIPSRHKILLSDEKTNDEFNRLGFKPEMIFSKPINVQQFIKYTSELFGINDIISPISRIKKRLLVVEDHHETQEIIFDYFKNNTNLELVLISDGGSALKYVSEHGGGVSGIILDVYLPNVSGFRIYEKARERGLSVVVISADALSVTRKQFPESVDYLIKPIDLKRLDECVQSMIGNV